MRIQRRLIGFIAIVQSVLFLAHFLLYETWTFSATASHAHEAAWIKLVLSLLSVSFVAASLLAFRYTNAAVRVFYKAAAVWVGLVSLLLLATASSWIILGVARLAGLEVPFHRMVEALYCAAAVAGLYGIFNASWTRITRTTVRLADLPTTWRGRKAALISDVHLGHVRNGSFLRRVVAKILKEEPDLILIAGDLFDGTAIDAGRAAEPLSRLTAPHGVYFVAGNYSNLGTTAGIWRRWRRLVCVCSAMRRWRRTACRLLAYRSGTRRRMDILRRRCVASAWTATARASC